MLVERCNSNRQADLEFAILMIKISRKFSHHKLRQLFYVDILSVSLSVFSLGFQNPFLTFNEIAEVQLLFLQIKHWYILQSTSIKFTCAKADREYVENYSPQSYHQNWLYKAKHNINKQYHSDLYLREAFQVEYFIYNATKWPEYFSTYIYVILFHSIRWRRDYFSASLSSPNRFYWNKITPRIYETFAH